MDCFVLTYMFVSFSLTEMLGTFLPARKLKYMGEYVEKQQTIVGETIVVIQSIFFCIRLNKAGKTAFLCMTKGVNITSASLSVRAHAHVRTLCLWNIIIDTEIVLEFLLQGSGPPCTAAVGLYYFFPSSTFWWLWNCLDVACVPQNSVYKMIHGHFQPALMFKACHFSLRSFTYIQLL